MSFVFLHISDLHCAEGHFDQKIVRDSFLNDLPRLCGNEYKPNLIFVTGDITKKGNRRGYDVATVFFNELLRALGVSKDRLFVIPGNHDISFDEDVELLETIPTESRSDIFFNKGRRLKHIAEKQGIFVSWYNDYFAGVKEFPVTSTCRGSTISINGTDVGILEINTALFCKDSSVDHGKLCIGRYCLLSEMSQLNDKKPSITIALMHHPVEWLSHIEIEVVSGILCSEVDILLCGHLHLPTLGVKGMVNSRMRILPCGALYHREDGSNTASLCRVQCGQLSHLPLRYEPRPTPCWTVNTSAYPEQKDYGHINCETLPRFLAKSPPLDSHVPSNISSRYNKPFVGRQPLLDNIEACFASPKAAMVVLFGKPGVGKSETAREYARQHNRNYPGGTFLVRIKANQLPMDFVTSIASQLGMTFPEDVDLPGRCGAVFVEITRRKSLLILDNAPTYECIEDWLPPANANCHLLVTTIHDADWQGADCLEVPPLTPEDSIKLVRCLAGATATAKKGAELVSFAGGLPVQICPAAHGLALAEKRGVIDTIEFHLEDRAHSSFQFAFDQLSEVCHLLLHATLSLDTQNFLGSELINGFGDHYRNKSRTLNKALATCREYNLLEGGGTLRIHHLFVLFLSQTEISLSTATELHKIRIAQVDRFLELARQIESSPLDQVILASFMSYRSSQIFATALELSISVEEFCVVGTALCEVSAFCEAELWFRHAVHELEMEAISDKYNESRLGSTLYMVGYCLFRQGKFSEAEKISMRAAEHEERNVRDQMDHGALARCLLQVGSCLLMQGQFENGLRWSERAEREAVKNNEIGQADQDLLSLCQLVVSSCFMSQDEFVWANTWAKRALGNTDIDESNVLPRHNLLAYTLQQVGWSYARLDNFTEAIDVFQNAFREAQLGDEHHRTDNVTLGTSLMGIGYCHFQLGNYANAISFLEKALNELEMGKEHNPLADQNIGMILLIVGGCHACQNNLDEARRWFERAASDVRSGNALGWWKRYALEQIPRFTNIISNITS